MLPSEEHIINDVRSGAYELHYHIKPNDVILDLGANLGYFTEIAARKAPKGLVIAIEPEPHNFAGLCKRVVEFSNVLPFRCGAMNGYGMQGFYYHELNCGGHSFFPASKHQKYLYQCPVIDIGHWLKCFVVDPNFIKIDTEGSEVLIISSLRDWGLFKQNPPHIVVETHCEAAYHAIADMVKYSHDFLPTTPHIGVCYATPK